MPHPPPFIRRFLATAAALAWGLASDGWAPGVSGRIRAALRDDRPNRADYEQWERGYYEPLLDVGRALDAPAPVAPRARAVPFDAGPLCLVVDDLREYVLRPNLATGHRGAPWTTNALGMRDRPYAAAKPPGTFRVAFVGDSIGAGWGVDDRQGFEPTLERALDADARRAGGPRVEILNFAVPGHAPGQRWDHFARVGWPMGPDLVLYEATAADPGWDERRLRALLARGVGWDSPVYRDALARAGARPGGDAEGYRSLLRPRRWEILAGVYRAVVADCQARGVPAFWVLVPRVGRPAGPGERSRLVDLARRAGFAAVIDLSDVYDGVEPTSLAIAPDDFHPNAAGHARLARRLESALADRPELGRLRPKPGGEAAPR